MEDKKKKKEDKKKRETSQKVSCALSSLQKVCFCITNCLCWTGVDKIYSLFARFLSPNNIIWNFQSWNCFNML